MSALPTDGSADAGSPASTDPGSTVTDPGDPTDPVRPSTPADLAGFAPCAVPYVRVSVRAAGVASSHAGYLLTFASTGQIACRLSGYPAVTVLDAKGHPVRQATGTPAVTWVASGRARRSRCWSGLAETASALLEGEVIDLRGKASRPNRGADHPAEHQDPGPGQGPHDHLRRGADPSGGGRDQRQFALSAGSAAQPAGRSLAYEHAC